MAEGAEALDEHRLLARPLGELDGPPGVFHGVRHVAGQHRHLGRELVGLRLDGVVARLPDRLQAQLERAGRALLAEPRHSEPGGGPERAGDIRAQERLQVGPRANRLAGADLVVRRVELTPEELRVIRRGEGDRLPGERGRGLDEQHQRPRRDREAANQRGEAEKVLAIKPAPRPTRRACASTARAWRSSARRSPAG